MVEQVTGGKALPAEVVQQIASKTDGVPLFVEELTKMVVESSLVREVEGHYELSGPLPPLAIPSTLHDSLMARLDRLATVREIAQVGATIGREFPYEILQAVSPLDEGTLQRGLKQLVEAELVYQSGVLPQARYLFKHALVQDAAYQSLLKSRRQQLHQQVAQVLTEQFPETVATQPELVAQHYTAAGLIAQAIPYWQQAGQRASQRGANVEAVSHLTTGLELLKTLPDTPARAQQELPLQLALGALLTATKGVAATEVEQPTAARGHCVSRPETGSKSAQRSSACRSIMPCGLSTRRRARWQISCSASRRRLRTRTCSLQRTFSRAAHGCGLASSWRRVPIWNKAWHSMIPSRIALLPSAMGETRESPVGWSPCKSCGSWAIRTRRSGAPKRPSSLSKDSPMSILWGMG
jgi:hypothetical protein